MNYRRGLFRLWVILTVLWVGGIAVSRVSQHCRLPSRLRKNGPLGETMVIITCRVMHCFEALGQSGKLTGDWIIYVKRGGMNYYLCITPHFSSDQAQVQCQALYDRIIEHASKDFPDIKQWIADEGGGGAQRP